MLRQKGMMGLKELRRASGQRYGSVNADPTLRIIGRPLEKIVDCSENFSPVVSSSSVQ